MQNVVSLRSSALELADACTPESKSLDANFRVRPKAPALRDTLLSGKLDAPSQVALAATGSSCKSASS